MGRTRISMTNEELDAFLHEQRTLRLATVDEDGWPAVVPVWFLWHDGVIWIYNLDRAKRTPRLEAGTNVAFTVDTGSEYLELRGVAGRLDYEILDEDEVDDAVRAAMGDKYLGGHPFPRQDDHTWIRMTPRGDLNSWDFRKLTEPRSS